MKPTNCKKTSVPIEFDEFIDGIAKQISDQTGLPKNKSQAMRLLARTYKDKIIFRGKKFDIRLF